jgi:beta-glucosidase
MATVILTAAGQDRVVQQPILGHRSAKVLQVDSLFFKDLNGNGKLDIYEDWRRSPEERAHDLIQRMSLEDLAGLMVHSNIPSIDGTVISMGGGYDFEKASALIGSKRINTFETRLDASPKILAESNNHLQEIAEHIGLGIPLTISSDPRSHFQFTPGASVQSGALHP